MVLRGDPGGGVPGHVVVLVVAPGFLPGAFFFGSCTFMEYLAFGPIAFAAGPVDAAAGDGD